MFNNDIRKFYIIELLNIGNFNKMLSVESLCYDVLMLYIHVYFILRHHNNQWLLDAARWSKKAVPTP